MTGLFGVVRAFALADPAITAVIADRWYPVKSPQGMSVPYVTMQLVVETDSHHLRGPRNVPRPIWQIDAWVREGTGVPAYQAVEELEGKIRNRLNGFSGVLTETWSPFRSFDVAMLFETLRDFYEPETNGGYFRKSMDYVIWHKPV